MNSLVCALAICVFCSFLPCCTTLDEDQRHRKILNSRISELTRILKKEDMLDIDQHAIIMTGVDALAADAESQIEEISREICRLDMFACLNLE